ncbi:MAG: GNAT family N-acetyltransferase [Desulfobacterales bacterium]|jgi:GNAT superfamily N-acetyltransferase|nr:GNAT family N-acetyltransferase [Desulfobacterales bacterium]
MRQTIVRGYTPGAVGLITRAHAVWYHTHWGFDASFEAQVGRELSDFIAGFEESRDGLWVAEEKTAFAGAVAVCGRRAAVDGARLRWFMVLPEFQGRGIGTDLLARAVAFCREKNYPKIFLWTFHGLDAARSLYTRFGFRLTEAHDVAQWGQFIHEEKLELALDT